MEKDSEKCFGIFNSVEKEKKKLPNAQSAH